MWVTSVRCVTVHGAGDQCEVCRYYVVTSVIRASVGD